VISPRLLAALRENENWFSTWFLKRIPKLAFLEDNPSYRRIVGAIEEKEAQYR
jgi:hypothetical protein